MSEIKKILIVEDEWIIANDVKMCLEKLGYSVPSVVPTGEMAVKEAERLRPSLVLMDIVLQGDLDGIGAADLIRKRLEIPVIYLTSYSEEKVLTQAKETEAFGYLLKPFKEAELKATIELALFKHGIEKKLKESENRLFTTLHSINDAVISTDDKGLVTFMNPLARELTGWDNMDTRGKKLCDVFEVRYCDREEGEGNVADVLSQGRLTVSHMTYTLVTREKWHMTIDLSSAPIVDRNGIISGVVIAFHDITKRIQEEEEIEKYRTRLEEIVKERTTQLRRINVQLEQEIGERKKMEERIKASLKEKELLLSEIHHRVGNNLQVIYGMLSIQKDYIEDSKGYEVLRGCQNRVLSMSLVHKALYRSSDLSRIDIGEFLKALSGRLYASFDVGRERINLKVDIADVFLGVDNAITCGLLVNELVSNSLKHAFPGESRGEISIVIRHVHEGTLELVVCDNGIGLDPQIDFRNTRTLGFKTVASFENNGQWGMFHLNRDNGTEFRICFKAGDR